MSDSFAHRDPHPHGAPIDRRQETYRPSAYPSQNTPPHGRVSPDGSRAYPQPSLTAKVMVWGGMAVAAAAVTAGSVLAVRKVADMVTGNDELDRDADRAAEKARERVYESERADRSGTSSRPSDSLAPRFADMTPSERDAMRRRQRSRQADMERHTDAIRAQAGSQRAPMRQRRRPKMGLLEEIETNASRISNSAEGIVGSLSAAMAGFRTVASQAEGVIKEFSDAADHIRGFLGTSAQPGDRPGTHSKRGTFKRPPKRDVVDLRDHTEAADAAARDYGATDLDPNNSGRTHRL